jgi:hypothetical protein
MMTRFGRGRELVTVPDLVAREIDAANQGGSTRRQGRLPLQAFGGVHRLEGQSPRGEEFGGFEAGLEGLPARMDFQHADRADVVFDMIDNATLKEMLTKNF